MISPEKLYHALAQQDIRFFAGVPDSLLKSFLQYLHDNSEANMHVITANEGLAVALASGYYFHTGKTPLVYLQNSGLGNLVNPLTSLADKEMYAIPMLLLIGWRGQPGVKDEPQHAKMGRVTPSLLNALEVPYYIMEPGESASFEKLVTAATQAKQEHRPVALLVPEGIFEEYAGREEAGSYPLVREQVIKQLIAAADGNETVICTTGKTGREFYEQNIIAGNKIRKYLLSAGAMGHANHIALGIGMHAAEKLMILDGDGAVLMHLGALPTIAHYAPGKLVHIVINNGSHESVGGQPTEGFHADLCGIARACGYQITECITNEKELQDWLMKGFKNEVTQFVEIRTNKKSRKDLGRPDGLPIDWKNNFMNEINRQQ